MTFFKELIRLTRMLFHRIRTDGTLDHVVMRHFPLKGYKYMMWCDNLITREEELLISKSAAQHEKIHLWQAMANYEKWYQYYMRYTWEWLKVLFRSGLSFRTAYACNPFEIEAKGNEDLRGYIVGRNTWKKYRLKKPRTTYKCNRGQWKQYCQQLAKEVNR